MSLPRTAPETTMVLPAPPACQERAIELQTRLPLEPFAPSPPLDLSLDCVDLSDPAPVREDEPCLPFNGTLAVWHREQPMVPITPLEFIGEALLWGWSKGSTSIGKPIAGRDVLRLAAAMTDPTIAEALALVASHLSQFHDLSEQGIARLLAEVGRFSRYAATMGTGTLAAITPGRALDFIEQPVETRSGAWVDPSVSTMHTRRAAIRLLFRTARHLHLVNGDPTIDIRLPPRSSGDVRPLEDDEEALGRTWSRVTLTSTRHAAAWALGQATATNSELASVTVADIDLANRRVWLHGNERKREPRWGQLSGWGIEQLNRRLVAIDTDPGVGLDPHRVVLTEATASRNARQASTNSLIADTLRFSGLAGEPGLKPSSVAAWAGRKVYDETLRIDLAARTLGVRSLDAAARQIRVTW